MPEIPAGFDFEDLARRGCDLAPPEVRDRIRVRQAERERAEATRIDLVGHFSRLVARRDGLRVDRAWTAPVRMRIEQGPDCEILRFLAGSTGDGGHPLDESFVLDRDLARGVAGLSGKPRPERVQVRTGLPGRRDACWVDPVDVEAYLREHRPDLFA